MGVTLSLLLFQALAQGDDPNACVETLGGHPRARTTKVKRLIDLGVSVNQGHCNIPICIPSRAGLVFGLYPHTFRLYGSFGPLRKVVAPFSWKGGSLGPFKPILCLLPRWMISSVTFSTPSSS